MAELPQIPSTETKVEPPVPQKIYESWFMTDFVVRADKDRKLSCNVEFRRFNNTTKELAPRGSENTARLRIDNLGELAESDAGVAQIMGMLVTKVTEIATSEGLL